MRERERKPFASADQQSAGINDGEAHHIALPFFPIHDDDDDDFSKNPHAFFAAVCMHKHVSALSRCFHNECHPSAAEAPSFTAASLVCSNCLIGTTNLGVSRASDQCYSRLGGRHALQSVVHQPRQDDYSRFGFCK
jgi:hypothetical protein